MELWLTNLVQLIFGRGMGMEMGMEMGEEKLDMQVVNGIVIKHETGTNGLINVLAPP